MSVSSSAKHACKRQEPSLLSNHIGFENHLNIQCLVHSHRLIRNGVHALLQTGICCICCAGFSARQRKLELERLNEQLRKINMNLRQQARAGTVYAPGLMYAPTPMPNVSIGSEDDGGNQGGAATLVVPGSRPEAPEDPQVAFLEFNSHIVTSNQIFTFPLCMYCR